KDIYSYNPRTASNLIWYWGMCGMPAGPLGLLYIDTSIPPLALVGESGLAGKGMAVLRDRVGTIEESVIFTGFGGINGIADREGHFHSDCGDFSFVWRGIPLVVHDGFGKDNCSKLLINRTSWRHNMVLHAGAGDSPVLPESSFKRAPVAMDSGESVMTPGDFYTDGISQFFTTSMVDYVCGPVRLTKCDISPSSHYRHFLFIKPDALLVWDQIESSFPLEWNLWVPVKNSRVEDNLLSLHIGNDIDLQIYFAGDTSLDFSEEKPPAEITWDWPLIMRTDYGRGTVTFTSLNLFGQDRSDSTAFAGELFHNILLQKGSPSLVGLITSNSRLGENLRDLGITYEPIDPNSLSTVEITKYSTLVIGETLSASWERALREYGWKISDFTREGGSLVIVGSSPSLWNSVAVMGMNVIPAPLSICSRALMPDTEITPIMRDDPIWQNPHRITPGLLNGWIAESVSPMMGIPEQPYAYSLPVYWSDSWKILASVTQTFSLSTSSLSGRLGIPSRIRVKHPPSRDFFTLFLPRKRGEADYLFDILYKEEGGVSFRDPMTTWVIRKGETAWTDANLSAHISNPEEIKLYAFDCTYIRTGTGEIRATGPMSIYYSERDDKGTIMTAADNTISYEIGVIKVKAGEIDFHGLRSELSLERLTWITGLHVIDSKGFPAAGARVYIEGRFIGATGNDGNLPIRWKDYPPMVRVLFRGKETLSNLVPGTVQVVIPDY
ncbi:hypothetical protein ACFL1R_09730, partial [Candidatus Latescibacterota bacterium]